MRSESRAATATSVRSFGRNRPLAPGAAALVAAAMAGIAPLPSAASAASAEPPTPVPRPPAAAERPSPPRPPADGRTDLTIDENIPEHAGADAIYPRFSTAYATLDVDLMADLYAEDAVYVTPDGLLKRGRAEIRDGFTRMFDHTVRNGERMEIRFRVLTRRVVDDVVTDVGLFTLDRFRGDEQIARDVGKFVTVASPGPDGTWRFDLDSYSMVNQGDPE